MVTEVPVAQLAVGYHGALVLAHIAFKAGTRLQGDRRNAIDPFIAAIAMFHGCVVVTDNDRVLSALMPAIR